MEMLVAMSAPQRDSRVEDLVFSDEDNLDIHANISDEELSGSKDEAPQLQERKKQESEADLSQKLSTDTRRSSTAKEDKHSGKRSGELEEGEVDDGVSRRKRSRRSSLEPAGPPRPADGQESRFLRVEGLPTSTPPRRVRRLLRQFGRIRGSCVRLDANGWYARFESVELASRARERLDNRRWSSRASTPLVVQFADSSSFERAHPIADQSSKRGRRDKSKGKKSRPKRKDEASQDSGNLLDKFFKKTSTIPVIYWLPLNEEQAKVKSIPLPTIDCQLLSDEEDSRSSRRDSQTRNRSRRPDSRASGKSLDEDSRESKDKGGRPKDGKRESKERPNSSDGQRRESKDRRRASKDKRPSSKDKRANLTGAGLDSKEQSDTTNDRKRKSKELKSKSKDKRKSNNEFETSRQESKERARRSKDKKHESKSKKRDSKDRRQKEAEDKKHEPRDRKQESEDKKHEPRDRKQESEDKKHEPKNDKKVKKHESKDDKTEPSGSKRESNGIKRDEESRDRKHEAKDKKEKRRDESAEEKRKSAIGVRRESETRRQTEEKREDKRRESAGAKSRKQDDSAADCNARTPDIEKSRSRISDKKDKSDIKKDKSDIKKDKSDKSDVKKDKSDVKKDKSDARKRKSERQADEIGDVASADEKRQRRYTTLQCRKR